MTNLPSTCPLRECPFCGGRPRQQSDGWLCCENGECAASQPDAEHWNKRTPAPVSGSAREAFEAWLAGEGEVGPVERIICWRVWQAALQSTSRAPEGQEAVPSLWVRVADDRPGSVHGGDVLAYRHQAEKPDDWGVWKPYYTHPRAAPDSGMEGMVLVPREPTEAMCHAAMLAAVTEENRGLEFAPMQAYRAMLKAAPLQMLDEQILYSLDRAIADNERLADELIRELDYNCEFPAVDADNLRKLRALIAAAPATQGEG